MPENHSPLTVAPLPADLVALVLMLHGGAESGLEPVDHRSLALRRTRAMFRRVAPRFAEAGVGTALLRFSVKGWNAGRGGLPSPVRDAREALTLLAADLPGVPVVILGHSMGARTAVRVADSPNVAGVVGLAPWFPPHDPVDALSGKHLIAAHGARDRVTNARHSRRYVDRAAQVAASAEFIDMGDLGHYLLRGARRWNEIAVTSALRIAHRPSGDRDDVGRITREN